MSTSAETKAQSWPGSTGQLSSGAGTAVTISSGIQLSGSTLKANAPGDLPSGGLFNWTLDGIGVYSNQGSGGNYTPIVGDNCSKGSCGLWKSTRTAVRSYAISNEWAAFCSTLSAPNTGLSFNLKNVSFTVELFGKIDHYLNDALLLAINDDGVGANAVYALPTSVDIRRSNSNVSISSSIPTRTQLHLAIVLDRSNTSNMIVTVYCNGAAVASQGLGSGEFATNFDQFSLFRNIAGTLGWARLTASALTAAQVRANTLICFEG